jgi:hypothetical protein
MISATCSTAAARRSPLTEMSTDELLHLCFDINKAVEA